MTSGLLGGLFSPYWVFLSSLDVVVCTWSSFISLAVFGCYTWEACYFLRGGSVVDLGKRGGGRIDLGEKKEKLQVGCNMWEKNLKNNKWFPF